MLPVKHNRQFRELLETLLIQINTHAVAGELFCSHGRLASRDVQVKVSCARAPTLADFDATSVAKTSGSGDIDSHEVQPS